MQRGNLKSKDLNATEDKQEWNQVMRDIQRQCRRGINSYTYKKFQKVKRPANINMIKDLFRKIRQSASKFKYRSWFNINENEIVVSKIREVMEVDGKYCEKLY